MLLTEYPPKSDAARACKYGRFALRIRSQADDYLVDLPSGKTSIGSSPRCNVRIQQPGVHPLHCLVACESNGLTVRRWAADARLNGQPFDDAPLGIGDHLSLGPVDVEVVGEQFEGPTGLHDDAGSFAEPVTEPASFSWGSDTIHHTTVWIGEEEEAPPVPAQQVEAQFAPEDEPQVESPAETATLSVGEPSDAAREVFRQLQTATAVSRARSRKLLAALRANREDCNKLTAQLDGLTNTKDELVAEHGALARERALLREQLATAENRYAEWDHQSNQWEELRKEWDAAKAGWEDERTAWTQQVGEMEARLAGHVSRIEELESQLAELQAADAKQAPMPPQVDSPTTAAREVLTAQAESADVSLPTWETHRETSAATPSRDSLANDNRSRTEAAPLPSVGFDWTRESAAGEAPSAPGTESSQPVQHAPARSIAAEAQIPAFEPQVPAEPPTWERHTPTWESEPPSWEDHGPTPGERSSPKNNGGRDPEPEFPEEPPKPETDALPTVATPVTAPEPAARPAAPMNPAVTGELPAPAAKRQQVSYIERFSPMFDEEESAAANRPSENVRSAVVTPVAGKPSNMPLIRSDGSAPAAPVGEHEESIEDYMAKLLQRVRGDRPHVAGSQAPQPAAPNAPPATSPANSAPAAAQSAAFSASTQSNEASEPLTMLSELVRKGPANERPQNLDALRALANESARHAIGVHASKKHRREAVTKFIVASLAGMTSLWLMMLAPDWRDLQFIVACVSLLIAAYWAGQVYGRLVEMSRAGDYDGPDDYFDDLNPPLPIDV